MIGNCFGDPPDSPWLTGCFPGTPGALGQGTMEELYQRLKRMGLDVERQPATRQPAPPRPPPPATPPRRRRKKPPLPPGTYWNDSSYVLGQPPQARPLIGALAAAGFFAIVGVFFAFADEPAPPRRPTRGDRPTLFGSRLPASAWIWARRAGGVPFAALKEGECFRFPSQELTYNIKAKRGWYVDPGRGRKFRTGSRTAVIPCPR